MPQLWLTRQRLNLRKIMGLIFGALKAVVGGFFGSLWNRLFPPKTAADQKAADLAQSQKDDANAVKIQDTVSRESDAVIDADLAKRMRPSADT